MRISLFGRFEVRRGDSPESFEARTAAELVATLALRHGRLVSRAELAATLWPDSDPRLADISLRKALQRARRVVDLRVEGRNVGLSPDIETDLDTFERLHRTYQLSPASPEGLASLRKEWEMVRRPLLEGWDSEWIEPMRLRYRFYADEIGCELAHALEDGGNERDALAVWRGVLDASPKHVEALQNTLRLESTLNKGLGAAAILRTVLPNLDGDDLEMVPKELRRIVEAMREGREDRLEPPEHFRQRGQQLLLAGLLEANLRSQGREGLAFLARECHSPLGQRHPRAMLRILHTALRASPSSTPEWFDLARQLVYLAGVCSEFDLGHRWADQVIERSKETDLNHISVVGMKGFMCFEQRRFEEAEVLMQRALELSRGLEDPNTHQRAQLRLAGLWFHLERYDEAIDAFDRVRAATERSSRPEDVDTFVWAQLNHACLELVRLEWTRALERAESCRHLLGEAVLAFRFHPMVLGLARVMTGDRSHGLRDLAQGVGLMHEERLTRLNHLAVEFAAIALVADGHERLGRSVLDAVVDHRMALQHERSPAERAMILATTGTSAEHRLEDNALRMQPLGALNQLLLEALDGREA